MEVEKRQESGVACESTSKHEDDVVVTDSDEVVRKQPGLMTGERRLGVGYVVAEGCGAVLRDEARPSGMAVRLFGSFRADIRLYARGGV